MAARGSGGSGNNRPRPRGGNGGRRSQPASGGNSPFQNQQRRGGGGRGNNNNMRNKGRKKQGIDTSGNVHPSFGVSNNPNVTIDRSGRIMNTSITNVNSITQSGFAGMTDEEVLISFMPYLKADNARAIGIHESYQSTNDSKTFLMATRIFLAEAQGHQLNSINLHQDQQSMINRSTEYQRPSAPSNNIFHSHVPGAAVAAVDMRSSANFNALPSPIGPIGLSQSPPFIAQSPPPSPAVHSKIFQQMSSPVLGTNLRDSAIVNNNSTNFLADLSATSSPYHAHCDTANDLLPPQSILPQQRGSSSLMMQSLEARLDLLLQDDDEDDIPPQKMQHPQSSIQIPATPSRKMQMSISNPSNFNTNSTAPTTINPQQKIQKAPKMNYAAASSNTKVSRVLSPKAEQTGNRTSRTNQSGINKNSSIPTASVNGGVSSALSTTKKEECDTLAGGNSNTNNTMKSKFVSAQNSNNVAMQSFTKKKDQQPKRYWTKPEEQPGQIYVKDHTSSTTKKNKVIDCQPRQELIARWILPLDYIVQKHEKNNKTKKNSSRNNHWQEQLDDLRLGLFRRGCSENGLQASIISKNIVKSSVQIIDTTIPFSKKGTNNRNAATIKKKMVIGTVPFYSPRTPGHVLFRLYWNSDPSYTLAIGPTLHVRVITLDDYESTIRFLLSNLKKKTNPTSLSSLHSLATVLEWQHNSSATSSQQSHRQPQQNYHHGHNHNHHHHHHQHRGNFNPTNMLSSSSPVGRSTWGCLCEARKVLDACALDHFKTSNKLLQLQKEVEEIKSQVKMEEHEQNENEQDLNDPSVNSSTSVGNVKKIKSTNSERSKEESSKNTAVASTHIDSGDKSRTSSVNEVKSDAVASASDSTADIGNKTNLQEQDHLSIAINSDGNNGDIKSVLKDKIRALMSGRASCERKWRDSQYAFANIIKAAITNPTMSLLLRHDLVNKLRLEYELWCPLCEEFATIVDFSPKNDNDSSQQKHNQQLQLQDNQHRKESNRKDIKEKNTAALTSESAGQSTVISSRTTTTAGSLSTDTQLRGDNHKMSPPKLWYEPLMKIQGGITTNHINICRKSRSKMQSGTLGFVPNTGVLKEILYPQHDNSSGHKQNKSNTSVNNSSSGMNPYAVQVLNSLSSAMGNIYQEEMYTNNKDENMQRYRENIRYQLESFIQQHCNNIFPVGTKVVIFGSSANGFGTPNSDLDMCLQLPFNKHILDDEDVTGMQAMTRMAELLENSSLATMSLSGEKIEGKEFIQDIDTSRLSARIPVIMFRCAIEIKGADKIAAIFGKKEKEDDDDNMFYIECDLSMHNPLAVLNTGFLRTYADMHPITRVLVYIVKRWAKARDINNPAKHTLSSYGYILMVLHFLTSHYRRTDGLIISLLTNALNTKKASNNAKDDRNTSNKKPLVPNLLCIDNAWPNSPPGTPYRESLVRPEVMIQHPQQQMQQKLLQQSLQSEQDENVSKQLKNMSKYNVNTYYYRPTNQNEYSFILQQFPGQDLSLAIVLASFFYYYAYEFDYKHFIISLHSTTNQGLMEREIKAEYDGWRHYNNNTAATITIEDPFETLYDVAHVLRGGYYHRIRREFVLAYTKIVNACSGNTTSVNIASEKGQSPESNVDCKNSATPNLSGSNDNNRKNEKDSAFMSGSDLINCICEPVVYLAKETMPSATAGTPPVLKKASTTAVPSTNVNGEE